MTSWKDAFREGLVSGSLAAMLSAAYLTLVGKRSDEPAAPLNAVSHWIFGDRSLRADEASVRYTVTGYVIHHVASVFWGVLHAKAWGGRPEAKDPLPAAAGAAVAAVVANVVDYKLTPQRLTPGFEHRLGRPQMANVYVCFAVGLMVGSMLMKKRR